MSYYRYISGLYKSYWPELNRTLRSSSVPRTVPELDPGRYVRGTSMPPGAYFSDTPTHYTTNCFLSPRMAGRSSASPFAERCLSVPPSSSSMALRSRAATVAPSSGYSSYQTGASHYSDFDCKVISYSAQLSRQDATRQEVSSNRSRNVSSEYELGRKHSWEADRSYRGTTPVRSYPQDSFSSRYDYYHGNKHGSENPIYPCTNEVLGTWKHYNLSGDTLNMRNNRARSPLQSRELNRYYETKRSTGSSLGSSGGFTDFRHYNYRSVPYFGGSDDYNYMKHFKCNGSRRESRRL